MTFPLFLLLFVFPEQVIVTVFGNEYLEAWRPLMLLSLRFMSRVIAGPAGLTLVAMGAPNQVMIGNVIGATLNVLLNATLIPSYGIVGASVATTTSYVVSSIYKLLILMKRGVKIHR